MDIKGILAGLAATLVLALAVPAAEPPAMIPVTHEELSRTLDDLAGQIHGLGERWRAHFSRGEAPGDRPLITLMLAYRQELGLSPAQVQELDRLRADFQREAIKRDADLKVAEMDLAALLKADSADMAKVEAKAREIERLRADLRLGRICAIEQGKALLTAEQRAKLGTLLAEHWPPRPRAGTGMPVPPPPSPQRM